MKSEEKRPLKILGVEDVRDTNETMFLHLIRNSQPVSQTNLVKATGLRAGTVSVVVNRLLKAGFICEGEEAPSNGGRPATYLQVNAEKAYAVAINIGVHQTSYLVSDFNGRVLTQRMLQTQSDAEPFLRHVAREISAHLTTRYRRARLAAVGVSIPGLIDRIEGVLVTSPNLGWSNVPIRSLLEDELSLPVHLENDANAAALSELWYGPMEVSSAHSFLFVLVVEGIGTGFVLNGELYFGTRIGLGGFGHIPLDPQGPLCSCGNIGCWEALASDGATLRRFQELHPDHSVHVRSMDDLVQLALEGNQAAISELLRSANLIGKGIRALAQGLGPEVIVLGGQITKAWPLIEPAIQAEVNSAYLVPGVSQPEIRRASMEQPSLFGAIPLALRSVLKNQNKKRD
ncbi:MAG: ROK family transcriptional regulator [Bryobacteraceae bacterium]